MRENAFAGLAQRIVVVISAAVALTALGRYLDTLGRHVADFGWFAYAPLNTSIPVPWKQPPAVHLAIWVGLVAVWALISTRIITAALGRRILLTVALAGALFALGQYLMTLRHQSAAGLQFLSTEQRVEVAGLPPEPWLQLLIWLGLALIWTLASLRLLRPRNAESEHHGEHEDDGRTRPGPIPA